MLAGNKIVAQWKFTVPPCPDELPRKPTNSCRQWNRVDRGLTLLEWSWIEHAPLALLIQFY